MKEETKLSQAELDKLVGKNSKQSQDHLRKARKVFVYFIPFFWEQGKDSGYASYEQPFIEKIEHIGQLQQGAILYGNQIQQTMIQKQMELRRNKVAFWKPWEKLHNLRIASKINTKPFKIYILDFKFLREQMEVIPDKKASVECRKEEVN